MLAAPGPLPSPQMPRILSLGDSLTRAGYASIAARDLRMNLVISGIGGQTTAQIGARYGAIRTIAIIEGKQIRAGANDITMLAPALLAASDTTTRSIAARIDGIPGILTRSVDGQGRERNRFMTASGRGLPRPAPAPVTVVVEPDVRQYNILLLCAGRNGAARDPAVYLEQIDKIVTHARTHVRHIVLIDIPLLATAEEAPGTPGHATIVAINRALAERYPDLILDINAVYTVGAAKAERLDGIHYNSIGARRWADAVTAFIRRKGWTGNRAR